MLTPVQSAEFDRLYLGHHAWLQRWFCKKLGCTFQAADLTQDTFVRLLLKQVEQHHFTTPHFYLLHIAKGLLVDHWRRQSLEKSYLDALLLQEPSQTSSLEVQAILLETLLEVDAMLDSLPLKVRKAFLFAQIDGLTYREIAELLTVSERMVKKYMASAMMHCLQYKRSMEML
ncbi:sigma-70 family RNA polymerase sigma factor [Methylophilus aquaticus]|uniref:Sigma-70 family RNA polymerase sigma factor n=1 Tax=Methylophilus aquaticus TaxID=1971610 RepID=A0ABT9JXR2_9PROT|nr:sigma-70 family RNA polymerase sigma factor [Methylophilus aquaticus]MDP8568720.1 sigma-70 family RNA polymerase sigma factor [Methylophilus aquaticus]